MTSNEAADRILWYSCRLFRCARYRPLVMAASIAVSQYFHRVGMVQLGCDCVRDECGVVVKSAVGGMPSSLDPGSVILAIA